MIKKRYLALYLLPASVLTFVFFIAPMFYLVYVSFFRWDGLSPMEFVGFSNYSFVFADRVFRLAFRNTLIWSATALLLHIPFGLFLSLLISKRLRGWRFMRVMYFIPNVISTTAIAFLWYFVYHADAGLLNVFLEGIGAGHLTRAWLGSIDTAQIFIQVPFVLYAGLTMIIFLTQLSTIPDDLYEAADIDGASSLQKDFYISIPLIKPALIINIMLNVAFCLRNFEYPFLMTSGGPANTTMNLSLYIFREMMGANRYGISMVAGLVTVLLGLLLMGIVALLNRRGVFR